MYHGCPPRYPNATARKGAYFVEDLDPPKNFVNDFAESVGYVCRESGKVSGNFELCLVEAPMAYGVIAGYGPIRYQAKSVLHETLADR